MYKEKLAIDDKIVAATPGVERKGKTMPYTSSNGYMFSLFNKDGEIGIRLPKDRQQQMKQEHGCDIFKSHGAVMRDYVLIPDALLENIDFVSSLLAEGNDFVNSLPPK